MSVPADIAVSVWAPLSGSTWKRVGRVAGWADLSASPSHLLAGPWSMNLPYNAQTAKIGKRNLLTFDFAGRRFTGRIDHIAPKSDETTGRPILELAGIDAMAIIGLALGFQVPGNALSNQNAVHYVASGPAETVMRDVIVANLVNRRGLPITVAPSLGRGLPINASLRMGNLLEFVLAKCAYAGLGVQVGLVSSDMRSTRADLTVSFYEPRDRTARVTLSQQAGTIRSWAQADDAPTATRVIEGGGGKFTARVYRQVIDAAVEADWGPLHAAEVFADARDTSNTAILDERGATDLMDAAAQSSFTLESAEAAGMRYGQHFVIGDLVTVKILDISTVQRLNAITLSASSEGVKVTLTPGNPLGGDPSLKQAAIIRSLRAQVRALQQEEDS